MRISPSRRLQHAIAVALMVIDLLAVHYFGEDLGSLIAERILRN